MTNLEFTAFSASTKSYWFYATDDVVKKFHVFKEIWRTLYAITESKLLFADIVNAFVISLCDDFYITITLYFDIYIQLHCFRVCHQPLQFHQFRANQWFKFVKTVGNL